MTTMMTLPPLPLLPPLPNHHHNQQQQGVFKKFPHFFPPDIIYLSFRHYQSIIS
jgi:hypothetical protein